MKQNIITAPDSNMLFNLLCLENEQTKKMISYIIDSLNRLSINVNSINQLIDQIDHVINLILLTESKNENYSFSSAHSYSMFSMSKDLSKCIAAAFINSYIVYMEVFKLYGLVGFNQNEIATFNPSILEEYWKFVTKKYPKNQRVSNYNNYLKIQEGNKINRSKPQK